jgi:predicted nucleotidyltransferase
MTRARAGRNREKRRAGGFSLNCAVGNAKLLRVVDLRDIQDYCDAIARAFRPDKIILFGSHAYGHPHRDSDVDVLVVLPRAKWGGRRPSLAIRRRISAGFPVDILVKAPRDIAKRLREGDSLLREIIENGRVMYDAGRM